MNRLGEGNAPEGQQVLKEERAEGDSPEGEDPSYGGHQGKGREKDIHQMADTRRNVWGKSSRWRTQGERMGKGDTPDGGHQKE